jgi:hypothetical protein
MIQPMPYTAAQQMLDAAKPARLSRVLEVGGAPERRRRCDRRPCRVDAVAFVGSLIEFYGGATNRIAVQDTAYP